VSLRFAFYEYPRGSGRTGEAITWVRDLLDSINQKWHVRVDADLLDGAYSFPEYSALLLDFLGECESLGRALNISWIHCLTLMAHTPGDGTKKWIEGLAEVWSGKEASFEVDPLEPWLNRLAVESQSWDKPPLRQFISIPDKPSRIQRQGGPWGGEILGEEWATAVERSGSRLSVYHAFLHLLGLDDGYDKRSLRTHPGCEDCWMQYDPTKGTGLCPNHLQQLRAFLTLVASNS
jgi:hypothetical protein